MITFMQNEHLAAISSSYIGYTALVRPSFTLLHSQYIFIGNMECICYYSIKYMVVIIRYDMPISCPGDSCRRTIMGDADQIKHWINRIRKVYISALDGIRNQGFTCSVEEERQSSNNLYSCAHQILV